jgi:hypothetical protein
MTLRPLLLLNVHSVIALRDLQHLFCALMVTIQLKKPLRWLLRMSVCTALTLTTAQMVINKDFAMQVTSVITEQV